MPAKGDVMGAGTLQKTLGIVIIWLIALGCGLDQTTSTQTEPPSSTATATVVPTVVPAPLPPSKASRIGDRNMSVFRGRGPSWSPDGTKISFSTTGTQLPYPNNAAIYVISPDGSSETRLTNPDNGRCITGIANMECISHSSPTWSPDGTKIAFVSERYVAQAKDVVHTSDIFVMNSNGSKQTNLTRDTTYVDKYGQIKGLSPDGKSLTTGVHHKNPKWSPDGTKIAFQTNRSDGADEHAKINWEIYVMDTDGSKPKYGANLINLTDNTNASSNQRADDQCPSWSPNGETIVYVSEGTDSQEQPGSQTDIWTMNFDGSGKTKVFSDALGNWCPTWAPDGLTLGFVARPNTAPGATPKPQQLYLVPLGFKSDWVVTWAWTSNLKIGDVATYSWSSDGKRLALGAEGIFIVDVKY